MNYSAASNGRNSAKSLNFKERRYSSNNTPTCDSRRYSQSYKSVAILPKPKSIHDYIDDFTEIMKNRLDSTYF